MFLLGIFNLAVAVVAIRPDAQLENHLQRVTNEIGGAFMNDRFRVDGAIHRLDVGEVDVPSSRVDATVVISYTFTNPYLRWNPAAFGNITQIVVDRTSLSSVSVEGYQRTLYIRETGEYVKSTVYSNGRVSTISTINTTNICSLSHAKPNEVRICDVCLAFNLAATASFDVDPAIHIETPRGWVAGGIWTEISWSGGGVIAFGGGGQKRMTMVKFSYNMKRYHIYNDWKLSHLIIATILVVAIVQMLLRRKILSTAAGLLVIILANYVTSQHFFSWELTNPAWLVVAPFVIIAAGATAICCIVVNGDILRPVNEKEEEKRRMIRVK